MAHPLSGPQEQNPTAEKYAGSKHLGVLPMGCMRCREGAKAVLFITGLCDKECFYCPVSRDRMYRDVVYVNEKEIHADDLEGLFAECDAMGAKGVGITGGDPLVVPHRVIEYITALKGRYGPDFHTHLYTSCAFDTQWIARLAEAGLDEIRFHPDAAAYSHMEDDWHNEAIRAAVATPMVTNVEIPALPGHEEAILDLCRYLEDAGATGLNMNELELSPPNVKALHGRGWGPRDDETQRVEGSRETAMHVLEAWTQHRLETGSSFTVHFCSSPYKDAVQLMQRFRRRAERTARPFDMQTDEGTIVFGVLKPADGKPGELAERLRADYDVPMDGVMVVDAHVEVAPEVAEVLADEGELEALGVQGWLSEVHPTATRIEVERIPLP